MYLCHTLLWRRYFEDILIFWTGPRKRLITFIEALNCNDFNISFTLNWHSDTLPFLDLIIHKTTEEDISTNPYRKDTAGSSLLHFQSDYPSHLISLILKG